MTNKTDDLGSARPGNEETKGLPVVALQRHTRGPNGSIYPASNGEFVLWADVAQRDAELAELRGDLARAREAANELREALGNTLDERDALQAELAAMREDRDRLKRMSDNYCALGMDAESRIRELEHKMDYCKASAPSQVAAEVVQVPRTDAESLIKAADVLIAKADGFSVSGVYFNEFDHNSVALITLGLEMDTLRALLATSQEKA